MDAHKLSKRWDYCERDDGTLYRCNDAWDNWIRWVVLVVVIAAFFLVFVGLSCYSARRRRRLGRAPIYGTRWAAYNYNPPTYQQSQQQPYYTPNNNATYNPAPAYNYNPNPQSPMPTGNSNAGYYNRDYSMQRPEQSYQPPQGQQDGVYMPPSGPPPSKV